jgi:hypothetical protein
MKVVTIADQIFKELDEPSDLSVPAIAYWVRNKIGELNDLIFTNFQINEVTLEVLDENGVEISEKAAAILKKMYSIHRLNSKIRARILALESNSVIEVSDDGATVRMVNKNEVIKSLTSLKKQESDELYKLVNGFILGDATPLQVAGDDTESHNNFPKFYRR